jgi:molecular chaperone DnaK (HSP70)
MSKQFVIGIDLGTTNSVLAYASLEGETAEVQLLSMPMVVDASTIENHNSLPSFLYLATEQEASGKSLELPWSDDQRFAVGPYARRRAAELPDRTVAAAKSWLCHSKVDRRQPILPWNAPDEIGKVSPVVASQRYIEHLVAAWHASFPDAPIADQEVVLTVPASFDAAARELTREAAFAAGLPTNLLLLEEPQAAVYSWLNTSGDDWREQLSVNDTILVCDIGGGTTDLTLVRTTDEEGGLQLQRIAVGDHLLVGGDNMDLALAHHVAERFKEQNVSLDPWQSVSLWHSCRAAKEALLAEDGPETHTISVLGRGSKLIGGTVTVDVAREDVAKFLLDGFLPACKAKDKPQKQSISGFQEIGLPFESDPAITRHLAAFVDSHSTDEQSAYPAHVLFNGGVFKSSALRNRLLESIGKWNPKSPTQPLQGGEDLDHAVAQGAAYYGWTKHHGGVRIRGGVARSYYVGIETSGLAVPGAPRPLRALCVVPFGMEEGTECEVPSGEFALVLGEQATFRLFSSATRKDDQPGALLNSWADEELIESDSLETSLPLDESIEDPYVPVRFHSKLTELGVFELWCAATRADGDWKLEFSIREDAEG